MQADKQSVINRLKTIKGHIGGIEKMVEDGKSCSDILVQVTAVRSSVHKVGLTILENNLFDCIAEEGEIEKDEFEQLMKLVLNYSK